MAPPTRRGLLTPESDVEGKPRARSAARRSRNARSRTPSNEKRVEFTPESLSQERNTANTKYSQYKERQRVLNRARKVASARQKRATKSSHPLTPPLTPPPTHTRTERRITRLSSRSPTPYVQATIESPDVSEAGSVDSELESAVRNRTPDSSQADYVFDEVPADGHGPLPMPESIQDILSTPATQIPLEEFAAAFDSLKSQIQLHCREFFTWEFPRSDSNDRSLLILEKKAPHTFKYLQHVADGSQYGWDKLLNVANQREKLVYAMISRALFAHIFDQELFGAQEEQKEALLDMCRTYINYDAFVRNIHRAKIIGKNLNVLDETDREAYFAPASETLTEQIQSLLSPLLEQPNLLAGPQPETVSLATIVQSAFRIHLAIRLRSARGTVFRFEHQTKMAPWDSTEMNCINKIRTDLTANDGDEALVKVPCFPAVFVYELARGAPTLETFTKEIFVKNWVRKASIDKVSGELKTTTITTYPLVRADVVLEQTPSAPSARVRFLTLSDALIHEARAMSDEKLRRVTGIDRRLARRRSSRRDLSRKLRPYLNTAALLLAPVGAGLLYTLARDKDFSVLRAHLARAQHSAGQLTSRANLATLRRAVRSGTQVLKSYTGGMVSTDRSRTLKKVLRVAKTVVQTVKTTARRRGRPGFLRGGSVKVRNMN